VAGGQVDAAVGGGASASAAYAQQQIRPLAIFHNERHPLMQDVPTAAEAGYPLEFGGWGGIYAPTGLPTDVRSKLESAIEQAANSEGFTSTIEKSGSLPVYRNAEEFTAFVNSEYTRFGELLRNG